jgi:hypothetical protein
MQKTESSCNDTVIVIRFGSITNSIEAGLDEVSDLGFEDWRRWFSYQKMTSLDIDPPRVRPRMTSEVV